MGLSVREATLEDANQMAELLNAIIEIGGTTAYLDPVTPRYIANKMTNSGPRASWHVADEDGAVLGFQWAAPHDQLPEDAADIASFVRVGAVGKGIGSRLFEATCAKTRALGYIWLNASIRSDNASGLTYYTKMGFTDWKIDPEAALSDGRITGKTHKQFFL